MTEAAKSRLTVIGVAVSIGISVVSFGQTVAVIPYRIEQMEKEAVINRDVKERLVRIEETVKNIERRLDRQNASFSNLVPILTRLASLKVELDDPFEE